MIFRYQILPELHVILEYYQGSFEYKEVLELKKQEMLDSEWKEDFHVLADIRKAEVKLTAKDYLNMHRFIENRNEFKVARKSAILTELPAHVVFGTLLKKYTVKEISLVIPEVFSTLKAAINWLEIDEAETQRIEELFVKLANG